MIRNFFDIVIKCISSIMSSGEFFTAVLLAIALGALCWVACSYYTRLWNKRFHVRFQHHLLCAFAAILTVIFTVQFRAVGNLELIVDDIIEYWHEKLIDNNDFHAQTYEHAFYTLKDMNPSAFKGVPEPGSRNSYIPFANNDMIQMCVETYVEEACANFSTRNPFLDMMLKAQPGISEDNIIADISEYFRTNPGTAYPLRRAIQIAAEHIRESLFKQSPETVWKTRLILVFLFLVVQMIPFGAITYFAYKDLKIGKQIYSYQQFLI